MWDALRQFASDYQTLLFALAWASAGLLIVSLVTLPIDAVMLPADFIAQRQRRPSDTPTSRRHPAFRWTARVFKNLLGVFLLLAGLAMLVLPGQGLLTLALALLLLDLPGKRRFEDRLLQSAWLNRPINRLRTFFGRAPLEQ